MFLVNFLSFYKGGEIMSVRTQKKPINYQTFLQYSALFVLVFGVIYAAFFIQGKTFIWEGDGFHQHYPFFREYLTIIRNFFETGQWQSWDWNIGLGQNTLTTYGYYVVGDPFVYLGLLFPKGSEELAFYFIMFVRIWAVGASFLLYARKMALSHRSALASSVMYAFSHYVIYNVVRHPFFIHPMIFFPLLCLGIEKVFRKESGVLFSLMVAISAVSNFYFFYMLTWMIFLYALLRYKSAVQAKGWVAFFKWFAYFVGLYLIGLLISAVIFVPLVHGFLNASRSASLPPISLLAYPLQYYGLLLVNSITPGTIYWTVGGLSVVGVLTLPFLTKRRHQRPTLFWGLMIIGVMLLFPFFGSLMNGMSGPYNRFTFVLPFYIALATAYFIDHFHEIKETDLTWIRRLLLAFSVFYLVISLMTGEYIFYLTPVVIGWIFYYLIQAQNTQKFSPKKFQQLLIGLVAFNMVINALNFYLPHGKYAMSETEDYGTLDEAYAEVFEGAEKNLPEDEWYRIGVSSKDNNVRNQYAYIDQPGTNSYASLTNGAVADFAQMLETSQYQIIQPLRNGIDDRRIANQALGVQYILTDEANASYLPPDYTINPELSDEETDILVAETAHEAPFAYVETNSISRTEAEQLHPLQRESLLANTVILEDEAKELQAPAEIPSLQTHAGKWSAGEGMNLEENKELNEALEVHVEDKNSPMTLSFDQPEELLDQEVFIYFEGIDYQPPATSPGVQASTAFRLNVSYNDQEKTVLQSDQYTFSSYFKRENILLHLNEVEEANEELVVEFEDPGHYSFENVSVVSRPLDEERIARDAQTKNEQALNIETFNNQQIKGTVDTAEDGMLVTNIPYSAGWQATVDGQAIPTEKVNVGFIGIPLAAGEHTIEFNYHTPFLKLGVVLTSVGLLLLGGYAILYKKIDF
jgi:uncharacterized membrane protein YfhO